MWRSSSPRKGLINGRTGRSTGRRSASAGTRYEPAGRMQPATCNPMSQPGTGSAMETTRSRSFMSTCAEQPPALPTEGIRNTLASDYLLARGCQLDRPELDVTGAAVGGHDDAVWRDVALEHAETRRLGALAKETLSRSQGDRVNLEPELVDQIVPEQRLNQVAASVHLELGAIFLLELLDLADDIAVDGDSLLPIGADGPVCDDVFRRPIDRIAGRVCRLRPITGKDVVGLPAQEQIEGMAHLLAHRLADGVIEKGH